MKKFMKAMSILVILSSGISCFAQENVVSKWMRTPKSGNSMKLLFYRGNTARLEEIDRYGNVSKIENMTYTGSPTKNGSGTITDANGDVGPFAIEGDKLYLMGGWMVFTNMQVIEQTDLLFEAVKNGNVSQVEAYIRAGGNVKGQDSANETVLVAAVKKGNKDIVQLLVNAGACVSEKGWYDRLPLVHAAGYKNKDIVEILIKAGADSYALDEALRNAARSGNKDIAQFLIMSGANVNARDGANGGLTVLMSAVLYKGTEDVVRLLIEQGADVNAKDYDGITALNYATSYGTRDVVELLRAAGATE